jgi:uncharacterized protein (DUF1697 family)
MKYVALLRGINVGGNNKVEMPKLKKCFESLGYTNVSTYINSGNVIFETTSTDPKGLVAQIEASIEKTFGFPVRVVIRSSANILKLNKTIPSDWNNDTEQSTDVLFLWDEYDTKKSLDFIASTPNVDTLRYIAGAIVWNMQRENYTKSSMRKFIGTTIYKNMTARNVNTVRKLAELMK